MPPGLLPNHKSSIVLFLERVYGIEDQSTFFRLLEDCILADLRAATTLDMVSLRIQNKYCKTQFIFETTDNLILTKLPNKEYLFFVI